MTMEHVIIAIFVAMALNCLRYFKYIQFTQAGIFKTDHCRLGSYDENTVGGVIHFLTLSVIAVLYLFTGLSKGDLPVGLFWLYVGVQFILPELNSIYMGMVRSQRYTNAAIRAHQEEQKKQTEELPETPSEEDETGAYPEERQKKEAQTFRKLVRTQLPENWHDVVIKAHDEHVAYGDDYFKYDGPVFYSSGERLFSSLQSLMKDTLPSLKGLDVGRGTPWQEHFGQWISTHPYVLSENNSGYDVAEWLHHMYAAHGPFSKALFEIKIATRIPDALRTQHHMILSGTGHGKTQCLQQMLLDDLNDKSACIIVMDSQGDKVADDTVPLMYNLLQVTPQDRLVYLDGGNLSQPLALGAFDIGSTTKEEDAPKVRNAVALYENMFAERETPLTTPQSTMYRFLCRLLFVIPNATFDTARSIIENGYGPFREHLDELDDTTRSFVVNELADPKDRSIKPAYKNTREEVKRRIYTLMQDPSLRNIFNATEAKVEIPQAIRDNKVILINTAQSSLGSEGASLFGKYCFAQIARELLDRPPTKKRVYFYMDEAQEYLSDAPVIRTLYEQGRRKGVCMITASQRLEAMEKAGVDRMLFDLTAIKFAGGNSSGDATKMAREMDVDADTIRSVPALSFQAWFKGTGTGVYTVTPGAMEKAAEATGVDVVERKRQMVELYHYTPEKSSQSVSDPNREPTAADYDSFWDDTYYENTDDRSAKQKKKVDPDAPQKLD